MTHYENAAPVSNQAGVQNIHGDLIIGGIGPSHKRTRYDTNGIIPQHVLERLLDDDLRASLAFPQMFDRRSNVESAHRQTCQWLFDMDQFRDWKANPRGLLWIKGKPGSGKSTLMSHLHRSLLLQRRNEGNVNLEFFFSARGVMLQHTFIGMLRSLLAQIFHQDPKIRQHLRDAYDEKCVSFGSGNASWEWQLPELKRLFLDTILASARDHQITILVDALDEAGDEVARDIATYLHTLNDHIAESTVTAKICISCRHYPIISSIEAAEIRVEEHNKSDINSYVKDHLKFKAIEAGESQQNLEDITRILIRMANGIFQWVCLVIPLVMKWLAEGDSTEQIRTSLSRVPKSLESVYEHILMKIIDPRHSKKTLRLFQWACLAPRPLSVLEIRHALSAESAAPGALSVRCHEVPDFEQSGSVMVRRITTWSGGLLESISSGTNAAQDRTGQSRDRCDEYIVQVIHQSVNDFMVARGLSLLLALNDCGERIEFASLSLLESKDAVQVSHSILYLSCLNYMSTEPHDGIVAEDSMDRPAYYDDVYDMETRSPFLRYSACYSLFHAQKSGTHRDLDLERETRLLNRSYSLMVFANRAWGRATTESWPHIKTGATLLHFASIANLTTLAAHRLEQGDNVNQTDVTGWASMHVAAVRGHSDMASLLHRSGADINAQTADDDTPLLLAASRGYTELFALLLTCGANINAMNTRSETVLYTAAQRASATIFNLCMEAGADVNAQGGFYGTALQAAAWDGHESAVRLLLKVGAKVDLQGGELGTALQMAARRNKETVVQLLLAAGADVNAQGGPYGHALQAAAYGASEKVVQALLEANANVNAEGGCYGNALQAAVCRRSANEEIVRLLLKAGANPSALGGQHGSLLQTIAWKGHEGILRLVLGAEFGVDVNYKGGLYGSALQAAAFNGSRVVVRLLLEAGADVNAEGGEFGNALQAAAYKGHEDVVRLLLDAGANVNAQGGVCANALQAAARSGVEEIVRLLLDAGADVNAYGGLFKSALSAAYERPIIDMLWAAGARNPLYQDGMDTEQVTSTSNGLSFTMKYN